MLIYGYFSFSSHLLIKISTFEKCSHIMQDCRKQNISTLYTCCFPGGNKGQSLLGPVPGSNMVPQPLLNADNTATGSLPSISGNKGQSLLGDAPVGQQSLLGPGRGNGIGGISIPGLPGITLPMPNKPVTGGDRSISAEQSILNQISQGLVNQVL